jgi:hypothetical protein
MFLLHNEAIPWSAAEAGKVLHATAVGLWADTLATDSKLADDRQAR